MMAVTNPADSGTLITYGPVGAAPDWVELSKFHFGTAQNVSR